MSGRTSRLLVVCNPPKSCEVQLRKVSQYRVNFISVRPVSRRWCAILLIANALWVG